MAAIPNCPNSVKGNGCWKSAVRLVKETAEAWSFRCDTCTCLFVVSKDGVRDRSQFELAAKRKKEAEEIYQERMRRRKIFA